MTENGTLEMGDSQFASHVKSLTPEEAKAQVDNYMRQVTANPQHPYNVSGPDHRRAVERAYRLREQAHSEDPDLKQYDENGEELIGTVDPVIQKIVDTALAEQQEKQNARVEEAQELMREMVKLGFNDDSDQIASDIKEFEIRCLRLQKLHAEKSPDFIPALEKELRTLGDFETLSIVQNFQATELLDEEMMSGVLSDLIVKINERHKTKGSK
jgi:hypothetical protein